MFMRRFRCAAFAAFALFGVASVASAAAPVISWTGFYLGANIGGATMSSPDYSFADPGHAAWWSCANCLLPYQSQTLSGGSDSAVIGGFHLGYNWQFAPAWLVGVEGDFSWTGLRNSVNGPLLSNSGPTPAIIPVAGSILVSKPTSNG